MSLAGMDGASMTGDELYGIVEAYAAFGDHHTGTDADWNTADWLCQRLSSIGASSVEQEMFEFDRYVVSMAELRTTDGEVIPSVPVFYSFAGSLEASSPATVSVTERAEGPAMGLDRWLDAIDGPAAVMALTGDGPEGRRRHPIQCNRVPSLRADGPAAVIVAADQLADVDDGVSLRFQAAIEPGRAVNVVAAFGHADEDPSLPPVTITTPLSGWTPAAGERGTGLAVALALATDLAADHAVEFVACSGHELDHIGLQHHLERTGLVDGRAVIHVGASVGAVEWVNGKAELGRERLVLTTATNDALLDRLRVSVARGNWSLVEPETWAGEGANWRNAGANVLSFIGSSSRFHTVGDVATAATTPELMATACGVVIDSARMFLNAHSG